MFLKCFLKIEVGHVLKMFLTFGQIWASRSYKLGSYKKKTCMKNKNWNLSRLLSDWHRKLSLDKKAIGNCLLTWHRKVSEVATIVKGMGKIALYTKQQPEWLDRGCRFGSGRNSKIGKDEGESERKSKIGIEIYQDDTVRPRFSAFPETDLIHVFLIVNIQINMREL